MLEGSHFKLPTAEIQGELRAFAGASLWITQTRIVVEFAIGSLCSKVISASKSVGELEEFIALSTKTLFRIATQHVPLRFVPLFAQRSPPRLMQLFSFSAASLSSSKEDQATEACVAALGIAQKRDGMAMCKGSVMFWESRKLIRIPMSSAQSGCLALSNTAEVTLAFQITLTEILIGEFQVESLRSSEASSSQSPFKNPQTTKC